ncbi:CLUMA_CG020204, isoform A [Clunio marinus]|uniref:CLUMA_CG020204, isoform A n=1 Tax=Clunio marinus TaxID=568069 RepID=A0A1J1J495_9DIPT|nr:CLUMA_CG020204, isoform A [Clunio marinus]
MNSPANSRQNLSAHGTPKSKNTRKSIFGTSSRKNVSLSGRSNASTMQIIARSEFNILESYGNAVPVKVTELLTFSDKNAAVSVNYSKNGWAWAVSGRKLLIWQYKGPSRFQGTSSAIGLTKTQSNRNTASQCRELTLPHCDIGHKARLITVFVPEGSQATACLAVSTTGDVRYWPSITNSTSIDENGIMEGQEFDQLTSISPQGYLMVTTTCNLVLLQIRLQNGRQRIIHRNVKPPSGFFGGFGKKFASIIIGMNSNQDSENKLIKIAYEAINSTDYHISILSEHFIQRWLFSPNTNETFLYEDQEISKKIRDFYRLKMWSNRNINETIDSWMLDMQTIDRGVMILAAAANPALSPQVYMSLITIVAESDGFQLKDFQLLRFKTFFSHQQTNLFSNFKFIIVRGIAYIYSERMILPVIIQSNQPLQPPSDDVEKIEFHTHDDRLIAAENIGGLPLFFSKLHGVVCVTPSDFEPELLNSSVNVSMTNVSIMSEVFSPKASLITDETSNLLSPSTTNIGNLTMYELDPEDICERNKDAVSQFKAAFIYHLKRNSAMCHSIINEMFKDESPKIDSKLDEIVVTIAKDLAEDLPAADPRWESEAFNRNSSAPLGSSSSMQILQQLREKNFCMIKFVEFLHGTGLWSRLMALSEKGNVRSTVFLLSDINERIVAAISFKCQQQAHARITDEAIEMVLNENRLEAHGNLTNQDVFFTKITKIQEIFKKFNEIIEKLVQQEDIPNNHIQNSIIEVNKMVLQTLQEIIKFREKHIGLYKPVNNELFEYLPWTAASDEEGLRDSILQLIQLTLQHGIRLNGETEYKFKHYQQMTELIDFVLDGRRNYLASIRNNQEKLNVLQHQYESQRFDLIYPLVEDEQYELAAKLAEKYYDFQTLVIICDRTENQQRLDEYIERFKQLNFSQFAINWHMKQNKQGDLFERFRNNQVELAKFLNNHPSLAWIQLIFNGEMNKSSNVLADLGLNETELVARKKTKLSLAKLSAYAAEMDMSQQIKDITKELHLIEHQNQIDKQILTDLGFDAKNMRVLQPGQMIELHISREYKNATEIEFRKAFELLAYVDDSLEYRNKIWSEAIERDDWLKIDIEAPLDRIVETLFFKLVELCYMLDGEIENTLPPIDIFTTSPELNHWNNKKFQFLIKLAYEHIRDTFK